MLTYDLSERGKVSIYQFLYQKIRDEILEGKLEPGEQLPSKRAFARHLNVSFVTVENAYDQLLKEGYIYAVERKGFFVEEAPGKKALHPQKKKKEDAAEEWQSDFLMNFKANRINLTKFPASVWSRYMREALAIDQDLLYKVIPYKGLYRLRKAIAEYLFSNRGMQVDPDQIIIGAGTEYLYSRLFQLLGRECILAIEDPGYTKIPKISESYGNRWIRIPMDEKGLLVDKLEDSDADAVIVSPANQFPTGIIMTPDRRKALEEWAGKIKKRYIIEDDYDSEFRYSKKLIPPLFAHDLQDKVIYMNTFSKTLVPTIRISYMILPPQLMKRYEDTMSFYSCTVSSVEQYTLARFIAEGHFERHINRMKKYYKVIRENILEEIRRSPINEFSVIEEHEAGTHFLLTIKTHWTTDEIKKRARQNKIFLNFYSDYSSEVPEDGMCKLVINYASIQEEQITEVVKRLNNVFLA